MLQTWDSILINKTWTVTNPISKNLMEVDSWNNYEFSSL